jgi:soluble lytic murein transglycosylase-like protein
VAAVLVAVVIARAGHPAPLRAPQARVMSAPAGGDPFLYRSSRASAFAARAIAGEAHVLFAESPGGAVATAARVTGLRPLIEAAVAGTSLDPDLLEGLVFVESAGRPDAVAGNDPSGAAGLTQILPSTATSLLGLRVDLPASRKLTAQIVRAQGNGASATAIAALERRRARSDQRFDPRRALAGAVRYLELADARFGREDLAVVAYHMGMGNLSHVLDLYDGGRAVPYVQLFFDSSPDHNPRTFALLSGFLDQSSLYYWRVLGAVEIMRMYRSDPAGLSRLAALQTAADSAAEVLHPPVHTPALATPAALEAAYGRGTLVPLPSNAAQLGLSYSGSIGYLARQLKAPAGLYRGLQPVALTLLLELAARVKALSGGLAPLRVTSAVTDERYQQLFGVADPPAAAGWSFTIARSYVGEAQRQALQAMLDRLQALNLIAWERFPAEIEVTVAGDAARVIAAGP